jgi:hypothetical protein
LPIAKLKPDYSSPVVSADQKIEPPQYKGVIVDDKQLPLGSLINYVEGAPWTVNYYSQVLGRDSDLRDFDPGQPNLYQQYSKITAAEIRVTTALNASMNAEDATETVTGTAILYPFMTPNKGDMFVANVGGGRDAVFVVDNIDRKSFNREAVFSIDYHMAFFVDADPDRFKILEDKVIRQYYFHKDRLTAGQSPTVIDTDHQRILDFKDAYRNLVSYYFKVFYAPRRSTLIIPGQFDDCYDPFVVNYVLQLVDVMDALEIKYIKELNMEKDPFLSQPQFWSVMASRNYIELSHCNQVMTLVGTNQFGFDPLLNSLAYTGVQHIVYPKKVDSSILDPDALDFKYESMASLLEVKNDQGVMHSISSDLYQDLNKSYPYANEVLVDDNYVLSSNFYSGTPNQTVLESLTTDYLLGNVIDGQKLSALCDRYRTWGRLEQFYYIPILMTLIKTALWEAHS